MENRRASGTVRSTGRLPRLGQGKRSERHRFRRTGAVLLRHGRDAMQGTRIEYAVERDGLRTCANCFLTCLAVTADNAEQITRPGRARRKIENEGFNCLARRGRNFKRNFGHGKAAPADGPTGPNLFAFALHAVLQCACALWQQCRRQLVTRDGLFRELQAALRWHPFPDWPTLLAAVRDGRAAGLGLASRQLRAGSVRRAVGRGLGTRRTRCGDRATAQPAIRRSRRAAS